MTILAKQLKALKKGDALLPCPFCGSAAEMESAIHPETADVLYRVLCSGAEADYDCPVVLQTHWAAGKPAARKLWNKRLTKASP